MRLAAAVCLCLLLHCSRTHSWLQPRSHTPYAKGPLQLPLRASKGSAGEGAGKDAQPMQPDKLHMTEGTAASLAEAVRPVEAMFRERLPRSFMATTADRSRNTHSSRSRGWWHARPNADADFDPYKATGECRAVNPQLTAQRKQLPAFKHREELIATIQANPVTIVVGPTGSGKSTQVPQFLLEAHSGQGADRSRCKIVCTQPRRMAASSLAQRVATERGEIPGQSVGYMMSQFQKVSPDTDLVYMTQGVLMRMLGDSPTLDGIDYVILDEVHERSLETDFLLPILRDVVKKRKDFRLVIMSATMHASEFVDYFGPSPVVSIQGRSFPVEEFFFDDVRELLNVSEPMDKIPAWSKRQRMSRTEMEQLEANSRFIADNIPYNIMQRLIEHIHQTEGEGAILVFLPGLSEIGVMRDMLQKSEFISHFKIHSLHSSIPIEEQMLVHEPPPSGQRKVILSTNIAESSITINDAVFVVDSGKRKASGIDVKTKAASLNVQWISQASATQRAGRAGRVRPGKCWHMIPSSIWEELPAFDTPEISCTPLEEVCLKAKALRVAPSRVNGTASFLSTVMTPPQPEVVEHAVSYLKEMGAFTQRESLTELGKCMGDLPLHPNLARAVLYGLLFKCLDPIVTLVAFIRDQSPFVMPLPARVTSKAAQQLLAGDEPSDHFAMWNAYLQYNDAVREKKAFEFCWQYFIAPSRMRIRSTKGQILGALADHGLISRESNLTAENENSHRWSVVKAALLAGLYPAVAAAHGRSLRSMVFERGRISPMSMNAKRADWPHRWLLYSRHTVYEGSHSVSGVTNVPSLPLLLLGGVGASAPPLKTWPVTNERQQTGRILVGLNDLIRVETEGRLGRVLQRARQALFKCFQLVVNRDRRIHEQPVKQFMDAVCAAIEEADATRTNLLGAEHASTTAMESTLDETAVPAADILDTRTPIRVLKKKERQSKE